MTKLAKDNPKLRAAIDAVIKTCEAHGISISHEDGHGAFVLHKWHGPTDNYDFNWLRQAHDETGVE